MKRGQRGKVRTIEVIQRIQLSLVRVGHWTTQSPLWILLHRSQINYATHFRQGAQHLESSSGLLYVIIHVASESWQEWNESTCATFGSWLETDGTITWGNWRKSCKGTVYQVAGRVKVNYPGKVCSHRSINSWNLFPHQVYRAKEVTGNPKRIIMWKEQPCRAMAFSRGPQPAMTGPQGRSWGNKYPTSLSSFGSQIFHLFIPYGQKKKKRKITNKKHRSEMWRCLLMVSMKVSLPEHRAEGGRWRVDTEEQTDVYTAQKTCNIVHGWVRNFISGSTLTK